MARSGWSVKAITGTCSDMDGPDTGYDNVFDVKFEMIYKKSTWHHQFKEMPLLDWQEKFTFVDHAKRTWWTFRANMYEHNRTSKTLKVWTLRYVVAYNTAMGLNSGLFGGLGSCTLYETNSSGESKKVTKLPTVEGDQAKADAVCEYLGKKGGKLEIVISDRPALNSKNAERLLLFIDVGVRILGSTKWNGYQHLSVSDTLEGREASAEHGTSDLVRPDGYNKVEPPAEVATRKDFPLLEGEVW